MTAATWPLPAEAYVPGRTPRPTASPAFEAAASAPAVTDPGTWQRNPAYLYGFRLYDAEFYWEAHEVWEPVWMNSPANSHGRALVQGLIQLANGCLKLAMERPRATQRLLTIAQDHLSEAGEVMIMGIDPQALAHDIVRFADTVSPHDRPRLVPQFPADNADS